MTCSNFSQACASTKLNKEYSKHDFWAMVPKEELYEQKLRCVFKYSIPEISDTKGLEKLILISKITP